MEIKKVIQGNFWNVGCDKFLSRFSWAEIENSDKN